uniref:FBD domain-containing protein n=1 Tax=Brassica oleracea var. oleracea TaxID=109376 RepID=A0A0D3E0B8_BRAOL
MKLPLLEELEVSYCSLSAESLEVVGQSCPNLKTLKLNREVLHRFSFFSEDDDALAIAETMPRLRHLQLFGNKLTDAGLNPEIMCRHVVDSSQGGLLEIDISRFSTDSLLNFIANRSSNLRSLKLTLISPRVTIEGLKEAIGKLPLLEELEITEFEMWGGYLKVVGQSCPKLKTLKLNCIRIGFGPPFYLSDDDALAIAETMHGLRNLKLLGNSLTDDGLKAILDNCPDLEHLDLGHCLNVNFSGDLEKRCSERIKFQILFSQQNPEKAGDDLLLLIMEEEICSPSRSHDTLNTLDKPHKQGRS